MKHNILKEKSYKFALRMVKLYKYMCERNEYVLSKQLVRSGTSVGANVEEALSSISDKEFVMKLQISYKEAKETIYWLNLLKDSEILEEKLANSLISDADELAAMLCSIIKTKKENMAQPPLNS